MIIEKEKNVEIIDEKKSQNNKEKPFKPTENPEKKSSKVWLIVLAIFIAIFVVTLLIIFIAFTIYNHNNNSIISQGIYINGIDVSGLTKEEAAVKVEEYYDEKLSNDITLVRDDYTAYIKTSEINLTYDISSAVDYAYNIGKSDNVFSDNYEVFNALLNGINIYPTYSYNEESLLEILNTLSAELPDAVVASGYYIDGTDLIITKGQDGYKINEEETSANIEEKLLDLSYISETIKISTVEASPEEVNIETIYNEIYKEAQDAYYTTEPHVVYPSENGMDFDISIEEAKELLDSSESECTIPLKILYPEVTTNMLGQEAFPDLLATYSTKYSTSNTNRTTNLILAASKIDGYVLLPDETFSYNTVVGERTIAAGYKEAAVYENGEVVQGLGGGICQISTTLYNAVLFANLEIVELYNHQFVPSYVTAGRDATVVYGVKDFQFKNSREYAIKITCTVSNGTATFQIWGVREETEYDVSVYATITSQTSMYIKASTYRTLKLNGETISTELIANSTYKAH